MTRCKECVPTSKRPAPHPGPRCATHHRAVLKLRKAVRHDSRVSKTYGIATGDYQRLYEAQGGRCAWGGCRATGKTRMLAVDHDHGCERGHPVDQACIECVRGLLCKYHNYTVLGILGRSGLEAGLEYLRDPPARRVLL